MRKLLFDLPSTRQKEDAKTFISLGWDENELPTYNLIYVCRLWRGVTEVTPPTMHFN